MLHAGMSSHPDFQNLRGLGTTYLDPSMEPNRWTTYITQTDQDQTSSEWIDIDIEMETKLNAAYEEVGGVLWCAVGSDAVCLLEVTLLF